MKYTARILNNQTKELRSFNSEIEGDSVDSLLFNWKEGNFHCDCNRHDFFTQSENLEADAPCGNTMYSVFQIVLENGDLLPVDKF